MAEIRAASCVCMRVQSLDSFSLSPSRHQLPSIGLRAPSIPMPPSMPPRLARRKTINALPNLFAVPIIFGHVFLSPYTKVEESFTLHAIHDVLAHPFTRAGLAKVGALAPMVLLCVGAELNSVGSLDVSRSSTEIVLTAHHHRTAVVPLRRAWCLVRMGHKQSTSTARRWVPLPYPCLIDPPTLRQSVRTSIDA